MQQVSSIGPTSQAQRYSKSLKSVKDEDANIGVILLKICLEATRRVTGWFITCASDTVRAEQPPRIMDALLPPMSRLTRVLQYMAKLYFDDFNEASRGWLLTAWMGFVSEAEHQASDPKSWRRLRVALRATMAYVWRKHVKELSGYPWKLLRLADERATDADKEAIVAEFNATPECCLPHGMARTLKAAKANLLSPHIKEFLYWTAFMLRMTVADVETRHARNLRTSGSKAGSNNVNFSTVVTQYVAAEYSDLRRSAVKAWGEGNADQHEGGDDDAPMPLALAAAGSAEPAGRARRLATSGFRRGKRAIDFFAQEHDLSEYKKKGKVTTEYWAKMKEDFEQLPGARKERYDSEAQRSHLEATDLEVREKAAAADSGRPLPIGAPQTLGAGLQLARASQPQHRRPVPLNIVHTDELPSGRGPVDVAGDTVVKFMAQVESTEAQLTDVVKAYEDNNEEAILAHLVKEESFEHFLQKSNVKTGGRRVGYVDKDGRRPCLGAIISPTKSSTRAIASASARRTRAMMRAWVCWPC